MFARTSRFSGHFRGGRGRPGPAGRPFLAAIAAAALVAGCAGSAATPSPAPVATPSPLFSQWPTSGPIEPTLGPTGTPIPTPHIVSGGAFDVAMGSAAQVKPDAAGVAIAGAAIDDFGFDLLRRLSADGNSCSSPLSIALALAMVRPGAMGETAAQMDAVLHGFGAPGQEARIAALIALLNAQTYFDPAAEPEPGRTPEPVVTLNVSDQVFSQPGMPLLPAYLDALSSSFGAGVGQLDFRSDPEAARGVINDWVDRNTAGRIPQILQPGDITDQTLIALANAIYLNAAWVHEFDAQKTADRAFTTAAGKSIQVRTMAQESSLPYAQGAGWRAVDLPLGGSGSTLSMTIVMPDNLASFVAALTSARLAEITAAERTWIVDLTLPRFSADYRVDLAGTLAAMGMPDLFADGKADLSGINGNVPVPIVVDKVIHQANIDVFEQGTTAAAATVVIGRAGAAPPETVPPKTTFHVDHPFLYLLREKTSGAVLFMGVIGDPSAG